MSEDNPSDERLRELMIGKTIASVEQTDEQTGVVTLDDGTVLTLEGNEGCGGCSEGWYSLTHLTPASGVITNVRSDVVEDGEYSERFRIFVVAADTETLVVSFDGGDNGYYGRGWWLTVGRAA